MGVEDGVHHRWGPALREHLLSRILRWDLLVAERAGDRLTDGLHLLHLRQRLGAAQDVFRTRMPAFGESTHRHGRDIPLVEERSRCRSVWPRASPGPAMAGRPAESFKFEHDRVYGHNSLSQPYAGPTTTGQSYGAGVAIDLSDPSQKVCTLVEANPNIGVGGPRAPFRQAVARYAARFHPPARSSDD
jgi:hypothetical protein